MVDRLSDADLNRLRGIFRNISALQAQTAAVESLIQSEEAHKQTLFELLRERYNMAPGDELAQDGTIVRKPAVDEPKADAAPRAKDVPDPKLRIIKKIPGGKPEQATLLPDPTDGTA